MFFHQITLFFYFVSIDFCYIVYYLLVLAKFMIFQFSLHKVFKPIRNTQSMFSNYSCGFIKVPCTVQRQQFHSSHYRRVFKIVITKAIKKKTACTVIKAIYEEFILKFGMCKHLSIISDNGLEFINRWSKTLYKLLGVNLCV